MPGTVLFAKTRAANKAKNPCNREAYLQIGKEAMHIINKLSNGLECDKCYGKQWIRVRRIGTKWSSGSQRALVEVTFELKFGRDELAMQILGSFQTQGAMRRPGWLERIRGESWRAE